MFVPRTPRLLRLGALSALLAFSGLTCTDVPTAPSGARGGPAALRFTPSFSVAAARVYDALGGFGLTVNNVHVHIDHPPAPAFDTVVVVPAGVDSLPLNLSVVLNGPTEVLNVLIELRDGTQVLFSGTQTVTATVGSTPSGPAPVVPFAYVGPGAGATQLAIAPRDTTIRITGGAQYRFSATDAQNAPVSGVTVAWSVADASLGTVSSGGAFTPAGVEGRTYVRGATVNGLLDSTTVTVTAPPTQVQLISGGAQTGAAGAALAQPLVVQASTAAGTPVPGVVVTFTAPANGDVNPASATTDLTGRAQTVMTLGHAAGAQSFGAGAAGLTGATATETATPAAAATLAKVSGDAQSDTAHAVLAHPLVVKVTDGFANPVAGVAIDWTRTFGGGTLAAASTTSDSTGQAQVGYTLGAVSGTDTISAAIRGVASSAVLFTATARQQPASIVIVSGNAQAAIAGAALASPLVVRVLDGHGAGVAGVTVAWSVSAGGGAVAPASSTTDSTGTTQATLVLGPTPGANTVIASVGSALTVSIAATGTVGVAATITKVAGDGQTAAANTAVAVKPSVRLADTHGNLIPGASVTFAVAGGGGSVTGAVQTTDATGTATVGGWTLGASGAQNLSATSGSLSATFSATVSSVGSAIASVTLNAHVDTLTSLGDTYQFTAQARDTANNAVGSQLAWVSRAPATATVSGAGLVTAVANGSTWVVATDTSGKRDSAQVVVQQRVATVLVSPSTRNIYLTQTYTFTAQAVDGRNHPLAVQPAITWSSSAPATMSVSSAGLATGLSLGAAQVRATSGAITGVSNVNIITAIQHIYVSRDSAGFSSAASDTFNMAALQLHRSYRAVAYDTLNNPIPGLTFTWVSSNPSVASIDSSGPATARALSLANGSDFIQASAQGVTGSAVLTVQQVLASIAITPASPSIAVSGSVALTARGKDSNNQFIAGGTFTWASASPSIATVASGTGVVTGVALGTSNITASSGAITSPADVVTVSASVPPAISFGRDTVSVGRGSSAQVPILLSTPSASPVVVSLAVADTFAYWSASSVTIPANQTSINAQINGHNAGTTHITATDNASVYAPATSVLAVQATMHLASGGYSLNATDQLSTQVLLSDPSPVGGTYITFTYGTNGIASVSPSPAYIPAGQLAANIVITAVAAGTTTITPVAIGVNGTSSSFTTYPSNLTFNTTTDRLGAGQYDPGVYVYVPTYTVNPIPVTFTSSDTTIATVTPAATIPSGYNYAYVTVSAKAPGTVTISASAPAWTSVNQVTLTSTTPHVGVCCGSGLNTTSPAQYYTVYSEDSTKSAHYRTSSLVVTASSSDTTVLKVLDTLVTIGPGSYYYSSGRVIPGGSGGSAYLKVSASGHTSDSTLYTVVGPKLAFSWTSNRVGAGEEDDNVYVYAPNNVLAPLTVTLTADTTIAGVPATVTMPTGYNYVYFNVRGKAVGAAQIIASAPGYQGDTATYTVTSPHLVLSGGGTLNNFSAPQGFTVYSADSLGSAHVRTTPLAVTFTSTNPSVLTVDTGVTIGAGSYYANSQHVTAVSVGTAQIIASAPGLASDTLSYTVQTPQLYLSFGTFTIGALEHRNPTDFYAYTPDNRSTPLTVTLSDNHPAVAGLSSNSLTITTGINNAYFTFAGLTPGIDTVTATAPGYLPTTAYIRVTTPKLTNSGLPTSTTTTNPPISVTVYTTDSLGSAHYASDTVVVHAVSSNPTVIQPAQAYFPVLKNNYYATTTVNVVGPGTASMTYSDSAGLGFLSTTTGSITVTGPSLAMSTASVVLGMRQNTGTNGLYVYTPNSVTSPLAVALTSTDSTVAVPTVDTVTIPTGDNYAYFQVNARDATGTIQIQANATGYGATLTTVQVTVPKFAISTSTQANTTSPPQSLYVYAEDANGNAHYTNENVTVTLASSAPSVATIDSASVTIVAGGYYNPNAHWIPAVVGTSQLSASDTRAASYKYSTGTANIQVNTPSLAFGNFNTLGIGQYSDNYFYVQAPDVQVNPLTVTLTHSGTARTTAPASVVIAAGTNYSYFRLIGTAAGTDTLVGSATSPAHNPATGYTVVGNGRIDPLSGWPGSSLATGDSALITIYARDPSTNVRNVLASTTFTLAPNANIAFVTGGASSTVITSIAIPAGATSVSLYVKALSAGTASATITATNYQTYTNTFTVTP